MNTRLIASVSILLGGALLTLAAGGIWQLYAVPLLLALATMGALRLLRPGPPASLPDADAAHPETPMLRAASRQIDDAQQSIDARVLGAWYRRRQREEVETVVNALLDEYIELIRVRLDVNTVAVFFPTTDGGYRIQRCSSRSEQIDRDAVIYPGKGVIGSFLKDGLKQLKLQDIVSDSKTLHYYTRDAGIRSLLASPIVTNGVERGTLIVDSTEPNFFTDEDHAYLARVAAVLSQTVYYAYLCTEYKLKHDRLVAMSTTEKEFFTHLEMDAILDRMVEIIPFAVSCDRLSISLKSDEGSEARVVRVFGSGTEGLAGLTFSLTERGLVPLVYSRNLCIFRDLSERHDEVRYCEAEPPARDLRSFIAVPLGVDECRGTLLLESARANTYSDTHRDLLMRLATSAGLAIEKLRTLEQARALATHDGLTGLINHRHFQQLLQEHLHRTKRYSEALTVVLCDIDHFKQVNDTYGHPFGDVVLRGVSEQLRESIRTGGDIAARYGGEEFALVLVKTDVDAAVETANRIREAIAGITFREPRGEEVHVTMSFGVAAFGTLAKDTATLIKRADQALYRAKELGRNRVEVF